MTGWLCYRWYRCRCWSWSGNCCCYCCCCGLWRWDIIVFIILAFLVGSLWHLLNLKMLLLLLLLCCSCCCCCSSSFRPISTLFSPSHPFTNLQFRSIICKKKASASASSTTSLLSPSLLPWHGIWYAVAWSRLDWRFFEWYSWMCFLFCVFPLSLYAWNWRAFFKYQTFFAKLKPKAKHSVRRLSVRPSIHPAVGRLSQLRLILFAFVKVLLPSFA